MGYIFEWDWKKAESNARKHSVTFDEASTCSEIHSGSSCPTRITLSMSNGMLYLGCQISKGSWW